MKGDVFGEVFRRLTCFLALLLTGAALPVFAQNPDRPIRAIGNFSNMRYTEEHAYGYAVELWRDGDSAIGLFLVSEGPGRHAHGDARKRKI